MRDQNNLSEDRAKFLVSLLSHGPSLPTKQEKGSVQNNSPRAGVMIGLVGTERCCHGKRQGPTKAVFLRVQDSPRSQLIGLPGVLKH